MYTSVSSSAFIQHSRSVDGKYLKITLTWESIEVISALVMVSVTLPYHFAYETSVSGWLDMYMRRNPDLAAMGSGFVAMAEWLGYSWKQETAPTVESGCRFDTPAQSEHDELSYLICNKQLLKLNITPLRFT